MSTAIDDLRQRIETLENRNNNKQPRRTYIKPILMVIFVVGTFGGVIAGAVIYARMTGLF